MPDLAPFRALRFAPDIELKRAICPPYDIIAPELAARLRREPLNAISVELPGPDGYEHARGAWAAWRGESRLALDERPSYTLLEQSFRWEGGTLTRRGLFGALRLAAPGSSAVVAHEKTLSKPKRDRRRLLSALRANTSPIFGAAADPGGRLSALLARLAARRPARALKSGDESLRLWIIDAPEDVRRVEAALRPQPMLIADGHHRYLVAWRFSRASRLPGAGRVLAYVCSEADPGLVVLPTHRVASLDAAQKARLERRLRREAARESCRSLAELERRLASAEPLAFGLASGRDLSLCRPKPGVAPRFGSGRATLDVQWVRRLLAGVDPGDVAYVKDAGEALKLAKARGAAAFFIKPPSLPAIRAAVGEAGLLPQKSTYFYPKVPTGIVFRDLEVVP